jgi:hypothetical protein
LFWPVVFDYTKIRTSDLTQEFPKAFMKNFFALLIVIGATTAVAFTYALAIKIDLDNNHECSPTTDRRRHSICNAWLLTDTILSFATLCLVYFEFKIGHNDFVRKYRSRVMFAHSFSYDKFVMTDSYADKEKEVQASLDARLKDTIIHKFRQDRISGLKTAEEKESMQ